MSVFSDIVSEHVSGARAIPGRDRVREPHAAFTAIRRGNELAFQQLIDESEAVGFVGRDDMLAALVKVALVVELIAEDMGLTALDEQARRSGSN